MKFLLLLYYQHFHIFLLKSGYKTTGQKSQSALQPLPISVHETGHVGQISIKGEEPMVLLS